MRNLIPYEHLGPAVDFLVLPRVIALVLMTPLLTLYADIVGILGGLTVGTQIMGFSSLHYFEQTQSALLSMGKSLRGFGKASHLGLSWGLLVAIRESIQVLAHPH